MIRKFTAPVVRNTRLSAPGHHVLEFRAPELARDARPGQFVAVAADASVTGTQFLRRPFSIFTADPQTGVASILFSVFGPTTKAMAEYGDGDTIDLLGPLGGHVFAPDGRAGVHHVMVGGGYGVPPLAFLSRTIRQADADALITFVNGARTGSLLVGTDGLADLNVTVSPCTNDGSCGYTGLVTGLLGEMLTADKGKPVAVYTCGPTPMMRAVAELAIAHDAPCQVSLEPFMPCGIGICMGCAVAKADGTFARGCTDGPVFDAREVQW